MDFVTRYCAVDPFKRFLVRLLLTVCSILIGRE